MEHSTILTKTDCDSCKKEKDILIPIFVLDEEKLHYSLDTQEIMVLKFYCTECFYERTNPIQCLNIDTPIISYAKKIIENNESKCHDDLYSDDMRKSIKSIDFKFTNNYKDVSINKSPEPWIINGKCHKPPKAICNLDYDCDSCPYSW